MNRVISPLSFHSKAAHAPHSSFTPIFNLSPADLVITAMQYVLVAKDTIYCTPCTHRRWRNAGQFARVPLLDAYACESHMKF